MANTPDFTGVYKAVVTDHKLGKSKGGYPQVIQKYALLEYFDQKDGEWLDVEDNKWSMVGYFCLVGMKDGERVKTLNHTQICDVYDWDGCGLAFVRDDQNFVGQVVQVRIDEDNYEHAKSPFCVGWINKEDADPNPGLRGVSDEEFDDLMGEFDDLFAEKTPKKKAAKAVKKTTKKTAKKTAAKKPPFEPDEQLDEDEAPEEPAEESPDDKKAKLAAKSARLKKAKEEEAKAKKKAPAPPAEKKDSGEYGKKQAWGEIYDRRTEDAEDDQVLAAWKAAIEEESGGEGESALDEDGWHNVVESVLAEIGEDDS